jgi:hypothetical protein
MSQTWLDGLFGAVQPHEGAHAELLALSRAVGYGRTMDPDWKALTPHRPLDPGEAAYVERPDGGRAIADLVLAGKSTVLVAGPVGVGKSTELAAAAQRLQTDRVACLVPLDRWENMRRITAERALLRIAGRLAYVAQRVLKLPLSPSLYASLVTHGVLTPDPALGNTLSNFQGSPAMLARATVEEVTRLSAQQHVAILVDGTEKISGESAAELFDALAALPEELDLVVVVPWSAAYGRPPASVIRQGERLFTLRALPVEGALGDDGQFFLRQMLVQRIAPASLTTDFRPILDCAAVWSGGIPRMFLQLVADAATNARLRRHGPWPTLEDLQNAVVDLRDSFRRILLPGDTEALRAVDGTDGREMLPDRKLRLLAHAALLERAGEHGPFMEPHPLVRMLIEPASHA